MKKIISAIIIVLSLASCVREVIEVPGDQPIDLEGKVTLNFSVMVPDAQNVSTKSLSDQAITSMTVIVFDAKGYKVEAVDVSLDEYIVQDSDNTQEKFTVQLTQSLSPRTLHFVANSPVKAEQIPFGTETEIMTQLVTSSYVDETTNKIIYPDAYWQCVKVNRLLAQDSDNLCKEGGLLYEIPLIRNFAKINVVLAEDVENFTLTGFELINIPKRGTVAPYNTSLGSGFFQTYFDSDKKGLNYDDLNPAYRGFMPIDFNVSEDILPNVPEDGHSWDKNPKYTYERTYVTTPTAVLIKGIFNKGTDTYYKAEIYRAPSEEMPEGHNYDILRNIEYTITITNVVGEGFSNAAAAANNVAGNALSSSVETASYSNISDGYGQLLVEYTSKRIVSDELFTLKYKFIPDIQKRNQVLNGIGEYINITLKPKTKDDPTTTNLDETAMPVINRDEAGVAEWEFDSTYGVDNDGWSQIVITPNDIKLGQNTVLEEDIIITANATYTVDGKDINVNLTRTVKLSKREPYTMIVDCPDEIIEGGLGKEVLVKTYIPTGLDEFMFPLVFAIEAEDLSLYPDVTKGAVMPVVSGQSIIDGVSKNTFHYERTVTYEEYKGLVTETISGTNMKLIPSYFLTNKQNAGSYVYVYNEYFGTERDNFDSWKVFENLAFPNGVMADAGSPTDFTFSMPTADPVTLTGLVPADDENRLVSVTKADGTYTFKPDASGDQKLKLKTIGGSEDVRVDLESEGYQSTYWLEKPKIQIIISKSATISIKWNQTQSSRAPNQIDNISVDVEDATVTYEAAQFGGSGTNRTVTISNLIFVGPNISDDSVVTMIISRNGQYQATTTTTIGALKTTN